jgi:hypothetical protein
LIFGLINAPIRHLSAHCCAAHTRWPLWVISRKVIECLERQSMATEPLIGLWKGKGGQQKRRSEGVPRSFADMQITDRQNVDIQITDRQNVDLQITDR